MGCPEWDQTSGEHCFCYYRLIPADRASSFDILKFYRTSSGALKLALCWFQLAEREKTHTCWSPSTEHPTDSSPSRLKMNLPPPLVTTRALLAGSWNSSSCPSPAIVRMCHSGTQTVIFTPAIFSSSLKEGSIFLGVEKMIGSRARTA